MGLNALEGIRVIDFSHVIAGPTASHYLALEGAEVIKVERPDKGDILRGRAHDMLDDGVSIGFAAINGGKQSLAIDLKNARCRELLRMLIASADVFIENFRPGATARLGFDYAAVKAIKPDIIYASISGFGQEGAWGPRAAYDHVVQSAVGMTMMQGVDGADPLKVGFPVIDTATGMVAAQAIMAAIIRRLRKGSGAYLDISMAQAALQLMWPDASRAGHTGADAPRIGNRGFSGSPGGSTFRCADGWVSTAANTAGQFRIFCEVLGLAHVLDDASLLDVAALSSGKGFVAATDAPRLQALLAEAIGRFSAADLEAKLAARDVPCAQLLTLAAFLKRAMAGGMLTLPQRHTSYPNGKLTDFGGGYKADYEDGQALPRAPRLGEHTAAILQSLGVQQSEIDSLGAAGALRA